MTLKVHAATFAAVAAALIWSVGAHAATDPTGIWFDHDGRGAVEIKQCASGSGLCGHVVYVVNPANASRCGLQILGAVTPNGGGWIYSPERKQKYDVALKRLSDDKLRVVGNAGSRFFSRTFTWNRAPDNIIRCGETTAAAPATETQPEAKAAAASPAVQDSQQPPAVTSGAATGSAALVATTPVKRSTEAAAKPVETKKAAPVAQKAVTGNAKAAPAKTQTAAVSANTPSASGPFAGTPDTSATETASDTGSNETGSKRKCKYKIPYVGRTISVTCRN